MAYVQQSNVVNQTFGNFANDLLQRILVVGARSSRIDVVFDDYRELSIKNVERSRRPKGSHILFISIVSSSEIKQWAMFLSSNENKNALVGFIVADGEIFKIYEDNVIAIPELESNNEEADTRIMLHAQHVSQDFPKNLVLSPDTDVFIICLSFQPVIDANYRRFIDIGAVVENIDQNPNLCESSKESLLSAFAGFHSFTGCDTVSAFAGRGKIKPLMLMMKTNDYVEMFASFGSGIEMEIH